MSIYTASVKYAIASGEARRLACLNAKEYPRAETVLLCSFSKNAQAEEK